MSKEFFEIKTSQEVGEELMDVPELIRVSAIERMYQDCESTDDPDDGIKIVVVGSQEIYPTRESYKELWDFLKTLE